MDLHLESQKYSFVDGLSSFKVGGNHTAWYWILLIVYAVLCVAVGLISLFFKPMKVIFKGLLLVFCSFINSLYIALFWWRYAIIRRAQNRQIPKAWRF